MSASARNLLMLPIVLVRIGECEASWLFGRASVVFAFEYDPYVGVAYAHSTQ
jgi:hypothetical protein